MSNNFSFVSFTAVLLIATGSAAAWTGYSFLKDTRADSFYVAETYELEVRRYANHLLGRQSSG